MFAHVGASGLDPVGVEDDEVIDDGIGVDSATEALGRLLVHASPVPRAF